MLSFKPSCGLFLPLLVVCAGFLQNFVYGPFYFYSLLIPKNSCWLVVYLATFKYTHMHPTHMHATHMHTHTQCAKQGGDWRSAILIQSLLHSFPLECQRETKNCGWTRNQTSRLQSPIQILDWILPGRPLLSVDCWQ